MNGLLLTQLLVMHVLGDFVLQTKAWIDHRNEHHFRSPYLYYHVFIQLLLALIVAIPQGASWIAPVVAVGHLVFDRLKSRWRRTDFTAFAVDQLLHILVILLCVAIYSDTDYDTIAALLDNEVFWWYTLGYALVVAAYPKFIQFATREWRKDIPEEREKLLNAGRWIGIIERVLVLSFVLAGQLTAVGFLMAAKSIFRFGDLKATKDKGHTEYVLIGTLLSFGLTIITGLIIVYFTK